MNILLINHYAGSADMGMAFRPYYLAKEWTKQGHKVTIIAAEYSHLRMKNPSVVTSFQEEYIDGIRYSWIKACKYSKNDAKRATNMFQFIETLISHAGYIAKRYKPDVIITSSTYPLDIYAGEKIKKKSGAKLIHEIHDMWPITPKELYGMSEHNPFVMIMQKGENRFCKKADRVVSILPCTKGYLMEHGMKGEKFRHVPNGILVDEWEHPDDLPSEQKEVLEKLKKEGKFVICFFGSHTRSYALEHLMDAIKSLNNKDICAVFIGGGDLKSELKRQAVGYQDQFYFLHPIPKTSIPSLFNYIDATYVGAIKTDMFRFGIGMNKLFDAMMGGKPILYAVEAPNNYVEEYNCGVSVEAQNTEKLAAGIEKLYKMSKKERDILGANGHKAALEEFNYSVVAKEFENILKEVVDK